MADLPLEGACRVGHTTMNHETSDDRHEEQLLGMSLVSSFTDLHKLFQARQHKFFAFMPLADMAGSKQSYMLTEHHLLDWSGCLEG